VNGAAAKPPPNSMTRTDQIEESKTLLKAQKIAHTKLCYGCQINCIVNHKADKTFWAAQDGIEPTPPVYDRLAHDGLMCCPKQTTAEVFGINQRKKKRR
jgi:hypothetical protein